MLELLGVIGLIFGLTFYVLGVIGIFRLPDTYSRLHAAGKVGTLGAIGLMVGAIFLLPEAGLKLIVLCGFVLLTGPISAHAIAASYYRTEAETDLEISER